MDKNNKNEASILLPPLVDFRDPNQKPPFDVSQIQFIKPTPEIEAEIRQHIEDKK